MTLVNLAEKSLEVAELLALARHGPVLVLTPEGEEFVLAEADDFDVEVEALRGSQAFQQFLDDRSVRGPLIALDDLDREIEQDLGIQSAPPGQ